MGASQRNTFINNPVIKNYTSESDTTAESLVKEINDAANKLKPAIKKAESTLNKIFTTSKKSAVAEAENAYNNYADAVVKLNNHIALANASAEAQANKERATLNEFNHRTRTWVHSSAIK